MLYIYKKFREFNLPQKRKIQTLISTQFFMLKGLDFVRPTSGANQEQMDEVMTSLCRRVQQRNCHSKSQHVDVCECRFVCWRTVGGCVMALRVLRQTGSSYE